MVPSQIVNIKAVIIDDEQLAIDLLERRLISTGKVEVLKTFINPVLGLDFILNNEVTIVFIDIHVPTINGLELAEKILEHKPNIIIIFVTAFNNYAVQAFEIHALDYLIKPVQLTRLEKTIERVEKQLCSIQSELAVTNLRINLFKYLSLMADGSTEETLHWRTIKAKQIFLFLLHHRGQLVSKSLLVDQFWPEYEPDKSYSQLYTTIYHIRKAVNRYSEYFIISNVSEGYILNLHNSIIDIEEWENEIITLPELNDDTINNYKKAMASYKGAYLEYIDLWWVESERQRLEQLWLRLAYQVAKWYLQSGDIDSSIEVYQKICHVTPYEEEAHFSLMKLYNQRRKFNLVVEQYNRLNEIVTTELGIEIRKEISTWYKNNVTEMIQ